MPRSKLEITNVAGQPIATVEDWGRLAPPAAAHHWVEGRSAMELARDWTEGDAASRTTHLLRQRPEFADLELRSAVAEKKTQFDSIRQGPRNHDLLIHGEAGGAPVTIGVEGKADEPFDLPIVEWLTKREAASEHSRARERLDALTRTLFQTTLEDTPDLGALPYQLFSALAGTLADARLDGAPIAVLLIHEFVTEKTTNEKHLANGTALPEFVRRLGPAEHVSASGGWLEGPWTIGGDGTWLPEQTTTFIGHLITRRVPRFRATVMPPNHPQALSPGESVVRTLGPEGAMRFGVGSQPQPSQ